ncbi:unnamed protein product, partial [Durusdinium trenchii]
MAPSGKAPIYLDYNGTTPIDPEVCRAMSLMMSQHWGNPSSSHYYGVQAKKAIETARRQCAELIGAEPGEMTFMSNGTETINQALKGLAEMGEAEGRRHFITQASEHVAVLEVCKALERHGCEVTYLPVDAEGLVNPQTLEAAITPRTICVSIMHSNNETGALQPIKEIVQRVRKASNRVYVHCDASQSLGKLPVDVNKLLGFSCDASRREVGCGPVDHGRPQALRAQRSWCLVQAIHRSSFASAPPWCRTGVGAPGEHRECDPHRGPGESVRDRAEGPGEEPEAHARDARQVISATSSRPWLQSMAPRSGQKLVFEGHLMRQNGPLEARLPNTLSASFFKVEANTLLSEAADEVAASAGAACHSDEVHMSHVLEAMGVSKEWAMGTCRFTLGRESTGQEVDQAAKVLAKIALRLMPGGPDEA